MLNFVLILDGYIYNKVTRYVTPNGLNKQNT